MKSVLVIGATGSIGRHVIDVALENEFEVHVLIRDPVAARALPKTIIIHIGDLTRPETLSAPASKVDSIVFTHGAPWNSRDTFESVDYGGVRNILAAIKGTPRRLALMTAIGVTNRNSDYNRSTHAPDWKRRSERLIRKSGHKYTIVRPGWFDYNNADEHKLLFLQGDKRWSGTPADGAISRRQIAEVLIASLECVEAEGKTLELIAEYGDMQANLTSLFANLASDTPSSFDGVADAENMPINDEPAQVLEDVKNLSNSAFNTL